MGRKHVVDMRDFSELDDDFQHDSRKKGYPAPKGKGGKGKGKGPRRIEVRTPTTVKAKTAPAVEVVPVAVEAAPAAETAPVAKAAPVRTQVDSEALMAELAMLCDTHGKPVTPVAAEAEALPAPETVIVTEAAPAETVTETVAAVAEPVVEAAPAALAEGDVRPEERVAPLAVPKERKRGFGDVFFDVLEKVTGSADPAVTPAKSTAPAVEDAPQADATDAKEETPKADEAAAKASFGKRLREIIGSAPSVKEPLTPLPIPAKEETLETEADTPAKPSLKEQLAAKFGKLKRTPVEETPAVEAAAVETATETPVEPPAKVVKRSAIAAFLDRKALAEAAKTTAPEPVEGEPSLLTKVTERFARKRKATVTDDTQAEPVAAVDTATPAASAPAEAEAEPDDSVMNAAAEEMAQAEAPATEETPAQDAPSDPTAAAVTARDSAAAAAQVAEEEARLLAELATVAEEALRDLPEETPSAPVRSLTYWEEKVLRASPRKKTGGLEVTVMVPRSPRV